MLHKSLLYLILLLSPITTLLATGNNENNNEQNRRIITCYEMTKDAARGIIPTVVGLSVAAAGVTLNINKIACDIPYDGILCGSGLTMYAYGMFNIAYFMVKYHILRTEYVAPQFL